MTTLLHMTYEFELSLFMHDFFYNNIILIMNLITLTFSYLFTIVVFVCDWDL